jgi:flagellar protein FlgJ
MAIDRTETNSQLFTDLTQLNSLKVKSRTDNGEALREVAQQFEQMFMNMMLKSMREASSSFSEDSYFNSSETQFFQSMLDQQMTTDLATQGQGIGLADVIVRQLGGASNAELVPLNQEAPGMTLGETQALQMQRLLQQTYDNSASVAAAAVLSNAVKPTSNESGSVARNVETAVANLASSTVQEQLPNRFESPKEFVEKLLPLAEKIAPELGVDPRVLLAQSALETGWGKHITRNPETTESSYNLFNIKAGSSWRDETVSVNTLEYTNGIPTTEQAQFRAYTSYESSFRDYVDFLKTSSRYQQALEQANNPLAYLQELQSAGYATDPEYANKISRILSTDVISALNLGDSRG